MELQELWNSTAVRGLQRVQTVQSLQMSVPYYRMMFSKVKMFTVCPGSVLSNPTSPISAPGDWCAVVALQSIVVYTALSNYNNNSLYF
jgi:hypothetical protein